MTFEQAIEQYLSEVIVSHQEEEYLRSWQESVHPSNGDIDELFSSNKFIADTKLYISRCFEERPKVVMLIKDFVLKMDEHNRRLLAVTDFNNVYRREEILVLLLKYLQGRPENGTRTREAIADYFSTSTNTINNYINDLHNGTSIFGEPVITNFARQTNEPESSVHPVFLPLNLVEIYSMLSLLKEQGDKDIRARIVHVLADKIFEQLTPYAKEKLAPMWEEGVEFNGASRGYQRVDRELVDEGIIFAKKEPRDYQIKYIDEEGNNAMLQGSVSWPKDKIGEEIIVYGNNAQTEIPWKNVVAIK